MNLYKTRLIRAKVVSEHPATCLYTNRERFFEYVTDSDLAKYINSQKEYTDFDQEGKNLLFEVTSLKAKRENLLDGAGYELHKANPDNYRS
jgi:hypothetical protein